MLTQVLVAQILANAHTLPPLELRWDVASAVHTCPDAQWFRDELASQLGRDPFQRSEEPSRGEVHVRVVGTTGEVSVEVLLTRAQETPLRVARVEGAPRRCRGLLVRTIEALSDVLLPREAPSIAVPNAVPPPSRVAEPEVPLRAVPTTSPAVADPHDTAAVHSLAAPPTETAAWHARVGLLAGAEFVGVPAPVSPLVAASLYVGRGMIDGVVGLRFEPLAGGAASAGSAANLSMEMERIGVELGACFLRSPLRFCGLGVGRWMWARAPGVESVETHTGFQLGGALRVEAMLPMGAWGDLLGRVDLALTGPKDFYVDGCDGARCATWRVGMLSVGAAVGVAMRAW